MRQAETALKDGRLDEAFELARAADVRGHRRGQDLVGRLARALAKRGQVHLAAGRMTQATADCEMAAALGGNLPEVAALRTAVVETAATRQDGERRKAAAVAAARDHLRNGELSIGQQFVEALEDTRRGEALQGDIAARREQAETLLARADEAVRRTDWAAAGPLLLRARELHSTNTRTAELIVQTGAGLLEQVRLALYQGRLDQARCLMTPARDLCGDSPACIELRGALELCGKSAAAIEQGACRRVIEILQRLRTVLPGAVWVADVLAEAQRAAESIEQLRGGPLGLLMSDGTVADDDTVIVRTDRVAAPALDRQPRVDGLLGAGPASPAPEAAKAHMGGAFRRFMLQVDGIGSFLVLSERSVTIGAATGSHRPDVPLLIDASMAPATLERADEDYFLCCPQGATVNNARVTRKLLVDGDRIQLSPRCHLRFAMPNAASTSALLSIAGTRMPGTDATRVILMDGSLVIGPGNAAHVRADALAAPAILHVRDGRMFCNAAAEVTVEGHAVDRQAGLPLNTQVKIGPVSMVIRSV